MRDFDSFDRTSNRIFGFAIVAWIIGAVASLGFAAGVLYLLYLLVQKL